MWEFATNMSEVLGGLLLLTWAVSGYRAGRLVFRPSRLVLDSTFLQGKYYEVSSRQVLASAVAPSRVEGPLRPWNARERDVKPWSLGSALRCWLPPQPQRPSPCPQLFSIRRCPAVQAAAY
jgi:hypothetical protein